MGSGESTESSDVNTNNNNTLKKRMLASMSSVPVGAGIDESVNLQRRSSESPTCDALPFARKLNDTITDLREQLDQIKRERDALLVTIAVGS